MVSKVRIGRKHPMTAGRITGNGLNLILVGALAGGDRIADQVRVRPGNGRLLTL